MMGAAYRDDGVLQILKPIVILMTVFTRLVVAGDKGDSQPSPKAVQWSSTALAQDDFFPICVWLQSPANAPKYATAGINTYVGLWQGPTESQLAELKKHGMRVVCSQNDVGLLHKDDPTILAWMHGDEPDNAQSLGKGKGYGPPIPARTIVSDFQRLREQDSSRPVLLNLGQGVAWDIWRGRGVRTNHPEDYPEYLKGCDIASFDIYPGCHDHPDVAGKIWLVAEGVSRLRKFSNDEKLVWNCIECTHVSNPKTKATPQEVKAEVWMSLVRGSRGLIYFSHQFQPKFIEAGLLADKEMLAVVTSTNQQIKDLAKVLNSPTVAKGVTIKSSAKDVPVEAIVKQHAGATYVIAVPFRPGATEAQFQITNFTGQSSVEVIGESREVKITDGRFSDKFDSWDVHLYRIPDKTP